MIFFRKHYFVFLTAVCLFFISCAQTEPDIAEVNYYVVFEYEKESSFPQARLCVFALSESDSRRSENLRLSAEKSNLVWDADNTVKIFSSNKYYSGYTDFYMQNNSAFPSENYKITLFNADQKSAESEFSLEYDGDFYKTKEDDVPGAMEKLRGRKKLILYNLENKIIYFGEVKDNLKNEEQMQIAFSNAASYSYVWETPDRHTICILQKKSLEKIE